MESAGSSAVDSCDVSLSDSVVSKATRQHLDYLASKSISRDISSWSKKTASSFSLQQTLEENAADLPRFYCQVFDCDSTEELIEKISGYAKDLEKACNILLDILLLYVKRCLNSSQSPSRILENKEMPRGKGLKLPASAIGWLSSHFSIQPFIHRLSIDTQNRFLVLPQLKVWLAKYVTHLHINGRDTWPPRIENGVMQPQHADSSFNIHPNHPLNDKTMGLENRNVEKISNLDISFLNLYQYIQHLPMVDFSLFPNLSVLILDGVPLEWISNLCAVREKLTILKVINACIYDANKLFNKHDKLKVNDSIQTAMDDMVQLVSLAPQPFPLLEHLTLSHSALGELSRMRGYDQFKPPLSYFPNLVSLDLSHNEINKMSTALTGLSDLMNLSTIDLSHNFLTSMKKCNMMVGNITTINLSHNCLAHVDGLDKLYSLENLIIDHNEIRSLADIVSITHLPQLMRLDVAGNPVVEEDPPLVRMHIMNCFLDARFEFIFIVDNPSYREVVNIIPKIDGSEISNDELVSIKELILKGSSADGTQTPDRNKSNKIQYGSKSQFTTTLIPICDDGGRVRRNVTRRVIEICDIDSCDDRFHDINPINHFRDNSRCNKCISLEEVIALQCNLLARNGDDESVIELSVGSKSVADDGGVFEPISKQHVTEINSAQEFPFDETIRRNSYESIDEIESFEDTYHSDSSGRQYLDNKLSFTLTNGYPYNEPTSLTDTIMSPQSVFLDDIATIGDDHESSASTNKQQETELNRQQLPYHNFAADEINSMYDGPVCYKDYLVSKYLDLYFKCFIFPFPKNDRFPSKKEVCNGTFPRIQLYQPDRELMLWINAERDQTNLFQRHDPPVSDVEKLVYFSKEDLIPCGISATSRISPNEKVNRGFHGDLVTDKGSTTYADSRKLIICVSNMAFYIVPIDLDSSKSSAVGSRAFPSPIPNNALFSYGLWAHASVRHPLKFLKRITIGFRFQRISLHFSLPWLRDALYINGGHSSESSCDYTYVILTHSKKRAVNFVQMLLNANKHTGETIEPPIEHCVQVNNDDVIVLENLVKLFPSVTWDEGIRHYQIVQQRWSSDRSPVRRLLILTNDNIFLLHEYYIGDGCYNWHSLPALNDLNIGDSVMELVESAEVSDIIDVSSALEESRLITITIKSQMRIIRSHRWRIICDDSEGAEKLVDDVRKTVATRGHR